MTFLSAWAVDGGRVPASMARRETYRSSNGETGITLPGDLLLRELAVPGPAIRIMPGAGVALNRYPGAVAQSYGIANDAEFELPIPATGSGAGAAPYVIVRVDDPEFGGQIPADPLTAAYNYPTLVSSVDNLTYPYLLLGRLDQPPSTATITQAMITNLGEVANPREKSHKYARPSLFGDVGLTLNAEDDDGEYFPNSGGVWDIAIPKWATRMQVEAKWLAVRSEGGTVSHGSFWMEFGPYLRPSVRERQATQRFSFDNDGGNTDRVNWIAGDEAAVPAEYRGTIQRFVFKARLNPAADHGISLTSSSGVILDVRFLEIAEA